MLDEKLHLLDFKTDSSASGLLFTNRDYRADANVSFDEILILDCAEELKASAVYFRRFENRSVPQLFVYDNSDNQLSQCDLIDIHRKLWSSGIVPLYYVFDNTEVRIFNSRKPLRTKRGSLHVEAFDSLSLISHAHAEYKRYSAIQFMNGSFWELHENKDRFKANNSAYSKLIEQLRQLRNAFVKRQNEAACNKLLVLSILVKYLEERKDSKGKRVLPEEYFGKFDGAKSFCEVLRNKKCLDLFDDLAKDINGKIFKLDEQEKKEIRKLNQGRLADFLDARRENQQYVFWKLYDFNYLPVELISRIYEEFIPDRKDITYTPSHLVNLMIDECMPINSPRENIRLIDVSCGSGIFLVGAFKRIVQWWQKQQYENTGDIPRPTLRKLNSILRNAIHGVDLEAEAVKLATFSLTVALCEMLDPTKAWKELTEEKLIDLSENLIAQDFFDFIQTNQKFDLVIGNPPFNPPFERKKERDKYWANLEERLEISFDIPDKNIALLFLQQAMKLLKKNGLLSLVAPSGPLLYNKTLGYRNSFLGKYNVPQIFDLSSLSGVLFDGRTVSVAVIFAQNAPPDNKDILHVTIRRTRTSKERLYFEIDKYDLYYVPKEIAKTEQLIWKANLLGSGHLYHLINRLQKLRSIEAYLDGWLYGEGYIVGDRSKKAAHLSGKNMIPTKKFRSDAIRDNDIETERESKFERPREREREIFKGPHILIKKSPSLWVTFRDDDLIFRSEIIGIHASNENQKRELIRLRESIKTHRNLYKFLLFSMSGRAGVSRSISTIRKEDIMALPYPADLRKLKLSKAEQIICDDVLEYGIEQISQGENSKACSTNATKRDLEAFGKVFCDSLNSIYKENSKQFYSLGYIESPSFFCFPFAYGNPGKPKSISQLSKTQIADGNLGSLIDNVQGASTLYKRIIKQYLRHRHMIFLVKPKLLRYWLRSIALRDANEVFADLVSSGY